jgi:Zn-dependent protease
VLDQDAPKRPLFSLFGVPVSISIWHVFVLFIMVARVVQQKPLLGFAMILVASLSVLLHEMGHALVSAGFGLRPEVSLVGFGGFTRHQPARRPRDEFLIVAAGPSVNLLLAGAFLIGSSYVHQPLLAEILGWGKQVNLVWAAYNLLPIVPLDGGQLARITMRRIFSKSPVRADRWTYRGGMGLAILLAAWFILSAGWLFAGIILAMAALQNWQLLKTLEDQPDARAEGAHPRVRELIETARQAFADGHYDEAMRACHQARAEPYVSREELQHLWHLLALAAARTESWEEALRYAERVNGSADMAQVQAACLLSLGDAQRAKRFLSTPAAVLLPPERVGALQELARTWDTAPVPNR